MDNQERCELVKRVVYNLIDKLLREFIESKFSLLIPKHLSHKEEATFLLGMEAGIFLVRDRIDNFVDKYVPLAVKPEDEFQFARRKVTK